MRKFYLALSACLLFAGANAQITPRTDTIPKKDSVVAELQDALLDNTPTISLDENELGDMGSQNVSSMLTAGRDPFFAVASFDFSEARFRMRGYDNDFFNVYMNGVPMDNMDNGFSPYGQWGGLNDVMRNKDVSFGLRYNTFAFGDIGSNTSIDARASKQRAQTSIGYALANRNYTHRIMLSHSTGMTRRGWAFSVAGSRRYAAEGYVPGTYYDGWSYFGAVDKRLNSRHMLSLIAFGAPTENGRQGAAIQEMYDYAGTNFYNPNWGYQNGKKRNASVAKTHQPVAILTHEFKIDANSTLITALSYTGGDRTISAFDWYNAPDPRPDYYRYLPSYYNGMANTDTSLTLYKQLQQRFRTDESVRQVNWDRIYDANRGNIRTVNNANNIPGNTLTGKRSVYIIEDRVINTKRFNANTVLNKTISEHIDFTGGLSYQRQRNHYYKEVNDLLGGDFYIDRNQFAERDFPNNPDAAQNDINRPNRILKVGDQFGYDYLMDQSKVAGWAQGVFRYNKVDVFASVEVSHSAFNREGKVATGLFPKNSLGKGEVFDFTNYGAKAGVTYKYNGRNYFYAHAFTGTRAPYFENVYLSPRTRQTAQQNVVSEKINSYEAGYNYNGPKAKIHLSGYYTTFKDGMDQMSFFHDGFQTFVNYSLSGINKKNVGLEFGAEYKLTPTWTVNGAAAIGQYVYDNRPTAVVSFDNLDSISATQTVYQKNYRIPSTPQQAYALGVSYRSPKFWFVNLSGNYFRETWLSTNPLRRTYEVTEGMDHNSQQFQDIIGQTEFKGQYTLDFFGGYSYKLKRQVAGKNAFLVFNAGVNNILNNKKMITGGYEQLRFDDQYKDINKFPPKLFYAYGLNYFLSLTFRF